MKTYKKVTLLTLTVALGVTTWLATSWQGKQVDKMMGLMDVDKKSNYFLPDQLEIVREQLSSKIPPPALKSEDLLSEQTGFGFVR